MIKPCHREAAKRLWRSPASNSCYSSYTPEIATPAGRLAMTQDFSCYKTGAMTTSTPTTHRNDKAITWNLKRKGVSSHCALTLGNYRFCPSPPGNATNTNLSLCYTATISMRHCEPVRTLAWQSASPVGEVAWRKAMTEGFADLKLP